MANCNGFLKWWPLGHLIAFKEGTILLVNLLKIVYTGLFQVRVRIMEGRQLSGSNISPVVRITVANHNRQTKVKHSTNKPFYDEVSCGMCTVALYMYL